MRYFIRENGAQREVSEADYLAYRQRPAPAEPTAAELATNFTGAMEGWARAGCPVVSQEQYAERSAACAACEHWDGAARLGLGKCNAPGCGCTKFKRWLATEKCPLGKWPAPLASSP